jgi:hypothetical protein
VLIWGEHSSRVNVLPITIGHMWAGHLHACGMLMHIRDDNFVLLTAMLAQRTPVSVYPLAACPLCGKADWYAPAAVAAVSAAAVSRVQRGAQHERW